jgi:acylphosphatase
MCGEEHEIDKMLEWLAHGPPQAEVDNIEAKKVPWQEHHFFAIS